MAACRPRVRRPRPGVALGPGPATGGAARPLSLTVGAWLLARRGAPGAAGGRALRRAAVVDRARRRACRGLGAALAEPAPGAALLVMGDALGAAGARAPGAPRPRGPPYDDAVAAALGRADAAALAALDPGSRATCSSRAGPPGRCWPAPRAGRPMGRAGSLHADAPYGVAYLVAAWTRPDRRPARLARCRRGRRSPIVAVVGPTAAGKSDLAVALALALDGEVVNADSMQLYRGMDIGTAKLTGAARRGVPHHLLDVLDVRRDRERGRVPAAGPGSLADSRARGRVPVLVGGRASTCGRSSTASTSRAPTRRCGPGSRPSSPRGRGGAACPAGGLDPAAAAAILPATGAGSSARWRSWS